MKRKNKLPVIGMAVAVLLGAAVCPFLLSREPDTEVSPAATVGQVRRVALFFHDSDGALLSAVTVIGDTGTPALTVVGYPAETEVIHKTAVTTLGALWDQGGEVLTARCWQATQAVTFDASLSLSAGAASAFVGWLGGGLVYDLPEAVGTMPRGRQTLAPFQIAEVLRYTAWRERECGTGLAAAELTASVLNRYLNESYDTEALFGKLAELCDTRLRIAQFVAVQSDLKTFSMANNGSICSAMAARGRMTGVGPVRRYVLTEEKAQKTANP